MDLITTADFKTFAQINHTNDDARIALLISDISSYLENLLGRYFTQANRIEYRDGGGRFVLNNRPITHVNSIVDVQLATDIILESNFSGSSLNWTLGAGWSLSNNRLYHDPASLSVEPIVYPVNVLAGQTSWLRFDALAVTAGSVLPSLGSSNGESCSASGRIDQLIVADAATSSFTITPTSDFDGYLDAIILTNVTDCIYDPTTFIFDEETGIVSRCNSLIDSDFYFEECPSKKYRHGLSWPLGQKRYRVDSLGGYSSVPFDVQYVARLMVAERYYQKDASLRSEQNGDSALNYTDTLNHHIRRIVNRYKDAIV